MPKSERLKVNDSSNKRPIMKDVTSQWKKVEVTATTRVTNIPHRPSGHCLIPSKYSCCFSFLEVVLEDTMTGELVEPYGVFDLTTLTGDAIVLNKQTYNVFISCVDGNEVIQKGEYILVRDEVYDMWLPLDNYDIPALKYIFSFLAKPHDVRNGILVCKSWFSWKKLKALNSALAYEKLTSKMFAWIGPPASIQDISVAQNAYGLILADSACKSPAFLNLKYYDLLRNPSYKFSVIDPEEDYSPEELASLPTSDNIGNVCKQIDEDISMESQKKRRKRHSAKNKNEEDYKMQIEIPMEWGECMKVHNGVLAALNQSNTSLCFNSFKRACVQNILPSTIDDFVEGFSGHNSWITIGENVGQDTFLYMNVDKKDPCFGYIAQFGMQLVSDLVATSFAQFIQAIYLEWDVFVAALKSEARLSDVMDINAQKMK